MVDQTIAERVELLGADLASDDKIPVWDTTAGTTKHIEAYELAKYLGDSGMYSVSVASFIAEGTTDHTSSFQAAIDSLPDADTIPETLDAGEWPSYSIYVPSLPDGSRYKITDYLTVGKRSLTWIVDDGVRIGGPAVSANLNWAYLNAPIVTERGIHMLGFANKKDHTGFSITMGEGAYNDREAGISGYNPDTVETQAYQHERGRAGLYIAVSDNGQFKYSGATTFTSTGFTIPTAMSAADAGKLRKGMFVDTDGTMTGTGGSTRFTSRLVSWSPESAPTTFVVEQWYKMDPTNPYAAAVTGTPTNGQSVIINPVNKVWGGNVNIFLNETDGATFGYTSSSIWEIGLANNTGTEADNDFNRDDHPFHFYGMDMAQIGSDGGGFPFLARGNGDTGAIWTAGFRNIGSKIGFHNDGVSLNDTQLGFVSSNGYTGNANLGDGTVTADFLSRTKIGGAYDNNFRIKGGVPTLELGRRNNQSQPVINLFSHGSAVDDNDWDTQLGFRSDTGEFYVDRQNAADADNATLLSLYSAGTRRGYFKARNSGVDFTGGTFSVDNTTFFVDTVNDKIGLGTTIPSERLHVNGNVQVDGNISVSGTVDGVNISNVINQDVRTTASPTFAGLTVDTDTLYIDSTNDRVGINTSTPSEALDVVGNIVVSGDVSASTVTVTSTGLGDLAGDEQTAGRFTVNPTFNSLNLDVKGRRIVDGTNWNRTEVRLEHNVDDVDATRTWIAFHNDSGITPDNILRFGEGVDTEWARFDNGKLGIGTTSPSDALSVVGNIAVTNTGGNLLTLTSTNTDGRSAVKLNTNGNGWEFGARGSADITAPNNFYLYDNAASAFRMVVDSSGSVGIGTTSPTSGYKLDVNGAAIVSGQFVVDTDTLYVRADTDRVGINTSTPDTAFHVVGDLTIGEAGGQMNVIRTNAAGQLQFLGNAIVNNNVIMTLDDDTNNVGINTATPSQALDVVGNIAVSGTVDGVDIANSLNQDVRTTASPSFSGLSVGSYNFGSYNSANTDITSLTGGSTFGGLLTAPSSGHYVVGLRENDAADGFHIISGGGASGTAYNDDGVFDTHVATFKANGLVGFGTNTPAERLHIQGNTRVEGNFYLGGNLSKLDATLGLFISSGGTGANLELYGSSHATQANNAYYDAAAHTFRSVDAAAERFKITSTLTTAYTPLLASGGLEVNTDYWSSTGLKLTGTAPSIYFSQNDTGSNAFAGVNGDTFFILRDADSNGTHEGSPYPLELKFASSGLWVYGDKVVVEGSSPSLTELTIGAGVVLSESTDRPDLLSINSSTTGWGGLQITNSAGDGLWSFMVDGPYAGLYDDQNNEWILLATENAGVNLRYNGSDRVVTTSAGVNVTGNISVTGTVDGVDISSTINQDVRTTASPTFVGATVDDLTVNDTIDLGGAILEGAEVVIADDASATIVTNSRYGGFVAMTCQPNSQYPQVNNYSGLFAADWGASTHVSTIFAGSHVETSTVAPANPLITTDGKVAFHVGGTSGHLHIGNRSGSTYTFSITIM